MTVGDLSRIINQLERTLECLFNHIEYEDIKQAYELIQSARDDLEKLKIT